MKKVISLILISLMILGLLTACSGVKNDAKQIAKKAVKNNVQDKMNDMKISDNHDITSLNNILDKLPSEKDIDMDFELETEVE